MGHPSVPSAGLGGRRKEIAPSPDVRQTDLLVKSIVKI
jgi:hypothetical protein